MARAGYPAFMFGTGDLVLVTYLNDHHALAVGGSELARRLATQQRESAHASELAGLRDALAQDVRTLREIMVDLDVPVRAYKATAAWVAEKVGRAKLNGRLLASSPSSPVLELEVLAMQAAAKAGLWRSLRAHARRDGRVDPGELDALLARAREQEDTATRLHAAYAEVAFAG